ncbi:MAG: hypothetical protein OQL28_05740 [Sedimenticola sp.]|nr:hypothetical protein [Sedimenticola sp.]
MFPYGEVDYQATGFSHSVDDRVSPGAGADQKTDWFIGSDVSGWNWDKNPNSHDAIVILDDNHETVGTPWRGNLHECIKSLCQIWSELLQSILAVRVRLSGSDKVVSGSVVGAFDFSRHIPTSETHTTLYQDIERFRLFSDGFLAWHPPDPTISGVVCYAMLPTGVHPSRGIGIDPDSPDQHVLFHTYRVMSKADRKVLFDPILEQSEWRGPPLRQCKRVASHF